MIVSVSVAPTLRSPIVTPENGSTARPTSSAWHACPLIVGATAGSLSVTVVVLSTVGVAGGAAQVAQRERGRRRGCWALPPSA